MIDSSNISFVITSFKSEENIYNCINSIPEKYEKIIIENSNDAELKKKIGIKISKSFLLFNERKFRLRER